MGRIQCWTTLILTSGLLVLAAPGAALAQEAEEEVATAGYQGGFFIRDTAGDYELRLRARVQPRLTLESEDPGEGGERDTDTAFALYRGILKLSGHVFDPSLQYGFQADFGRGFVKLQDFFIDYAFSDALHLRFGQWKVPFSRQRITSDSSLELVDRAITDSAFRAGRDVGVAVHNDYERADGFQWAIGVFNGTGERERFSGVVALEPGETTAEVQNGRFTNVPDEFHPAVAFRVGYQTEDMGGYSEADLEGGPLRFAAAMSGIADFDVDGGDDSGLRGELDYIVKVDGFSSTAGLYLETAQEGAELDDQTFHQLGLHLQVGHLLGDMFQPVVRYALVAPDGEDNDVQEITAGLSIYFFRHQFKWQIDGSVLLSQDPAGDLTDYRGRTQLQLYF